MANAYSHLHNYAQELYTPNFDLIGKVMQYKQGKLDANREKLQSLNDQIAMIDVAKDVDKEYVDRRLNTARDIANQYASLDLSNDGLANDLIGKLSSVIDDNVKNAVLSTRTYRAEQAEWGKLAEDEPDAYNAVNHSFAMQGANAWLDDQSIGKKYKGGGGVIRYEDVQGKLNEQLPKIAKMLGDNVEVSIEGGGTVFRDKVTRQRVSQNEIDQAMSTILDGKDMRQLSINAWGKYDKMSDDQIASQYADFYAPKINNIKESISSLSGVINKLPEGDKKEARKAELKNLQNVLDSYESNDYLSVVKNSGRENAYTSMYVDSFKQPYLGLYSFDKITAIETYDNDVQTRNYALNLEKHALSVRQQEFAEAQAIFKSQQDGSISGVGLNGKGPMDGNEVPLNYDEMESTTAQELAKEAAIIGEVKNLFGITDAATLRDLKTEVFDKGLKIGDSIKFNGKEIKLDKNNMMVLNDYEHNILNTPPAVKEATEKFNKEMNKGLWTLRKVAQGDNPDIDFYNSTPKYNFKFIEDEATGLMKKVSIDGTNNNNYSRLLKKKDLTDAEKYTLDVYYKMHTLADPKILAPQKKMIFDDLRRNTFSKLGNEDYNSFPDNIGFYSESLHYQNKREFMGHNTSEEFSNSNFFKKFGDIYEQRMTTLGIDQGEGRGGIVRDASLAKYDPAIKKLDAAYKKLSEQTTEGGRKAVQSKITNLENLLEKELRMISPRKGGGAVSNSYRQDYFLSDFGSGDTEYYDDKGQEVSLRSIDDIVENASRIYTESIESFNKSKSDQGRMKEKIFVKGTNGYNTLTSSLGLSANTDKPITIWRGFDEKTKKPTDAVYYYYTEGTGKNKIEVGYKMKDGKPVPIEGTSPINLTTEQLASNGAIVFDNGGPSPYKASFGKNAPVIKLGNNTHSPAVKAQNMKTYGTSLAMHETNLDGIFKVAQETGGNELVGEVARVHNNFIRNKYSFNVEAEDGIWKCAMYDENNNRLYATSIDSNPTTELSKDDVVSLQVDSERLINQVAYEYMYSRVDKSFINNAANSGVKDFSNFYNQYITE